MVTILHNSISYVVWSVWKLDGYISCTIHQVMMQDSILNFFLCGVHNQRSSCEWDDGHSEGSCGELITSCRKIWLCAEWCSHILWKPKVLKLRSPKLIKMFCLLGHLFVCAFKNFMKCKKFWNWEHLKRTWIWVMHTGSCSQPPLLSMMVRAIYDVDHDEALLKLALPLLVQEHQFWTSGLQHNNPSLNFWHVFHQF